MNEEKVKEALAHIEANFMTRPKVDELKALLQEALAPEQRFYKGQHVLVCDSAEEWKRDILLDIDSDLIYPFRCIGSHWKQCKPDPDAVTLPNWIEWSGGDQPVDDDVFVVAEFDDENRGGGFAEEFAWNSPNSPILRYCVIPKIEWL